MDVVSFNGVVCFMRYERLDFPTLTSPINVTLYSFFFFIFLFFETALNIETNPITSIDHDFWIDDIVLSFEDCNLPTTVKDNINDTFIPVQEEISCDVKVSKVRKWVIGKLLHNGRTDIGIAVHSSPGLLFDVAADLWKKEESHPNKQVA